MAGADEKETKWRPAEVPWDVFCGNFAESKVGKKEGPAFAPGWSRTEGGRTSARTECIDMLVLDCDAGDPVDSAIKRLRERGWAAVVYTTYSHLKTETEVGKKAWETWLKDHDSDVSTAGAFLVGAKKMHEHIVKDAKLVRIDKDKAIFSHKPCPRFRIVVLLKRPWRRSDYKGLAKAETAWRAMLDAATQALEVQLDQNARDLARLFYFARVPDGAALADYRCEVIEGEPLDAYALVQAAGASGAADVNGSGAAAGGIEFDPEIRAAMDADGVDNSALRAGIGGWDGVFAVADYPGVRALMAAMPNSTARDRGQAVAVVYALRRSLPENPAMAEEIFLEWESRYEGGSDPKEGKHLWDSAQGESTTNGVKLLLMARDDCGMDLRDFGLEWVSGTRQGRPGRFWWLYGDRRRRSAPGRRGLQGRL